MFFRIVALAFAPGKIETRLNCVKVTTAARLHLGFLDLNGGLGRRFGSIGLAVDAFETSLELRGGEGFSVHGLERDRSATLARRIAANLGLDLTGRLDILDAMPAHAGLGSGTQLALSIAAAVRRIAGLAPDARGDALVLDRGARSGVGAALFERGGLVVDAGRGDDANVPPVVAHLDFPKDWRIILVLDPGKTGVHGEAELRAFAELPIFPAAKAADICRLTLMQILPGVAEADMKAFGGAISRVQELVGDHFAPAQGGGRFTSPAVGHVAERLKWLGARGIGQSSWGPTGFAFFADPDEAEYVAKRAREDAESGVQIVVCRARAHGAVVSANN
jgi:beta-ribofuranosylaminobenzene 5'-phosphate synthase